MRKREIYVWGYIHSCGGAGPELLHQIELWQQFDVEVHLVVMPGTDVLNPSEPRRQWCDARGIHTHAYTPGLLKDKVVVSFCENEFMAKLPQIVADGRPRCTIWFNCMTWNHGEEIKHQRDGLIDLFGFQSQYQRKVLWPALEATGRSVGVLEGYVPYYHLQNDWQNPSFRDRSDDEAWMVGRLSRDDPSKFPANLWELFGRISAPKPRRYWVVGYGSNAREKCGDPQTHTDAVKLNRVWWGYCYEPKQLMNEFWPKLSVLFHVWDGFKENYPRALLEAMAAGVPIICDAAGGNPEIIEDGVNGFCVRSQDEAVYRASQLAWNPTLNRLMVKMALDRLKATVGNPQIAWKAWDAVL